MLAASSLSNFPTTSCSPASIMGSRDFSKISMAFSGLPDCSSDSTTFCIGPKFFSSASNTRCASAEAWSQSEFLRYRSRRSSVCSPPFSRSAAFSRSWAALATLPWEECDRALTITAAELLGSSFSALSASFSLSPCSPRASARCEADTYASMASRVWPMA